VKGVLLRVTAGIAAACVFSVCALAGGAPAVGATGPSQIATSTIPAGLLLLFQHAAAASPCGVPWTLLAAVADTESAFGPTAVSSAGAEGLFQFEPATFTEYADPVPPAGEVPSNPFNPVDAAYAAARYLCSLGVVANPTSALVAYNCGNPGPVCQAASAAYAEQVLATAASYTAATTGVPNGVPAAALAYAESQIGTPYVWGGSSPAAGFDCSGLVVWAYGLAGVVIPRVANDQWQKGVAVALDQLVPGDLVFFGTGGYADHVGIYIGNSAMVDAPHTGADVRIDAFSAVLGAGWGSEVLLGASDPVAG
jgi:cell wall-associated NlpC family hydrolase